MANGNIKIDAPPEELGGLIDLLGNADPESFRRALGDTRVPTVDPNLMVSLSRRAAAPPPQVSAPVNLRTFGTMPPTGDDTPPPKSLSPFGTVYGPPLRGGMGWPVPPPSQSPTTIAPTSGWHQKGILGKVGEVAKDIGTGAAAVFAPGLLPFIPGSPIQKEWKESDEQRREQAGATESLTEAETDRAKAEAEKARATEMPKPGTPEEQSYQSLLGQMNSETGKLYTPIEALKRVKEAGQRPTVTHEALERVEIMGPDNKPVMANYHKDTGTYTDQSGQPIANAQPVQKEPTDKPVAGTAGGKPAWGQFVAGKGWVDPSTQQPITGFQPPLTFAETGLFEPTEINVGGKLVPGKFDRRTGRITTTDVAGGGPVAIPRALESEINKIMDTARGADTRYGVMVDNEKPALGGNQQAMVNILANHMGMTQGLQKGSRINQAMWDEATASAPWIDRVLSKFTKVDSATGNRVLTGPLSGITLTPDQIKQMVDLGQDRRMREWQQVAHTASQNGLDLSAEIPRDVREGIAKAEGTKGAGTPKVYRAINPATGVVHEGTTPPPAGWKIVSQP